MRPFPSTRCGAAEQLVRRDRLRGDVAALAQGHQRSHLQEVELRLPGRIGVEVHGELDLDRETQVPAAGFEQLVEDGAKREDVVLEDARERDHAAAAPAHAVVDPILVRGHHAAGKRQRPVRLGLRELQPGQRGIRAAQQVGFAALEVQGEELPLRDLHDFGGRPELRQDLRVARAEAHRIAPLDHLLAQAQGDGRHAVLRLHLEDRVVVVRLGHA